MKANEKINWSGYHWVCSKDNTPVPYYEALFDGVTTAPIDVLRKCYELGFHLQDANGNKLNLAD